MANRYIHPNDEFDININLKVRVTSVGDWSGITKETTEGNYEMIKNNGNLQKWIEDHLRNQIMWSNDFTTDLLDRVIFEVVDE